MALVARKSKFKKTPLLMIKALSRRIGSLGIGNVFAGRVIQSWVAAQDMNGISL